MFLAVLALHPANHNGFLSFSIAKKGIPTVSHAAWSHDYLMYKDTSGALLYIAIPLCNSLASWPIGGDLILNSGK